MYFTRLTSNMNGWEHPSGRIGKCTNPNLFEAEFGFGFEEWLMNKGNRKGGIQYGYIQAFTAMKHRGKWFDDLMLYTRIQINGICTNFRVGVIEKLYVLQNHELNGFLNHERVEAMRNDLVHVQLDSQEFDRQLDLDHMNIINVKFRVEDVKFEFDENDIFLQETRIEHHELANRYRFKLYQMNAYHQL